MAASFPSALKTFTTKVSGETIQPAHVNDLQLEVAAIETALLSGAALTLKPSAANTYDLGTSTYTWRNLYLAGTSTLGGAVTASSTVSITGQTRIGTGGFSGIPTPATTADEFVIQGAASVGMTFLTDSAALGAADRTQTVAFGAAGVGAADAYLQYRTQYRDLILGTGGLARWTVESDGDLVGSAGANLYLYYTSASHYVGLKTSASVPGALYFMSGATGAGTKLVLDPSGHLYPATASASRLGADGYEWQQMIAGAGTSSLPSLIAGAGTAWTGQFQDLSGAAVQWNVGFSAALTSGWSTRLTLRDTLSGTGGPLLTLAATAAGSSAAGAQLVIGRNTSSLGAAGSLALQNKGGTPYYLWADTNGQLRYGSTVPVEASGDTGGISVSNDHVVNVKAYGAKGDGTTDDYTAIAAAIVAGAGRVVYFPPGTYRIATGLTIASTQTTLRGSQQFGTGTSTIITYDGTGTALTIGANHCTVEHLQFTSYNLSARAATQLSTGGYNGLTVRDCTFLYADTQAILATSALWSRFERCVFQPHGGIGIKAVNSFNANTIDQCKFLYSATETWTAIELASGASANCTGNVIRGCSFDGGDPGGYAIKLYDKVYQLLIEGCRAETNGLGGVWTADETADITLVGNNWGGATASKMNPALYLDGGYITVIGDGFWAATLGIEATANCQGLTLINCYYGSDVTTSKSLSSHLTTPGTTANGYFTEIAKGKLTYGPMCGTFTLDNAATTTVTDTRITASSVVFLMPTNAAAASLMAGASSLYISAQVAGTSFTVATAGGGDAAGTETFNYWFVM